MIELVALFWFREMMFDRFVALSSLLLVLSCGNVFASDIYTNCGESIKCPEDNLIKLVDEVDNKPEVSLLGDYVVVEKIGDEHYVPRSEEGIVERVIRYVSNHELKIRLPSGVSRRSLIEESRKKKKLQRILLPLLILLKLKALIIIPAVLFGIALIAYKGVGAGLMALFISLGVALKNILEKSHGNTLSYEILQTPHWSRTGDASGAAWAGLVPGYSTIP